jgi:hypothetical protein
MTSSTKNQKHTGLTSIRVFALFATFIVVGVVGYFVSLLARGYEFDPATLTFFENGILVAKSDPDGASIYINGDLRGATNTNLRLPPKSYYLEIKKDGHLTWSKELNIKKEEVTQITAQLFKTVPSFSPVTYNGAKNPVVSPDFSKIAYTNNEGLWILSVSSLPIGFPNEPKKILEKPVPEYISLKFSPNSRELMLETKLAVFVLNTNEVNNQSGLINVISRKETILKNWEEEKEKKETAELKLVPDEVSKILLTSTSSFTFSPDETMVMYTASDTATFKKDLIAKLPGSSTQKEERDIKVGKTYIYDIKEDKNFMVNDTGRSLYWLPTSRHLLLPDEGKVIVMDYDGTNRQTVFSGNYVSPHAYPFVNASKLLILTNLGSSESITNLYSMSIK